jgi:hypothetical protein
MITSFYLRMTIKDIFQPVQSYIFVNPLFLRDYKICNLSILIEIIKPGVLY